MRVVGTPGIRFTCTFCRAENEGAPDEFEELNTMPPSFRAQCANCEGWVTCFPSALVQRSAARVVADRVHSPEDALALLRAMLRRTRQEVHQERPAPVLRIKVLKAPR